MDDKFSDKIIAIIPARGGSKGIPRKSIRLLAGKPLIAYTIEAALKLKYADKVVVSTEDWKIAEISKKHGAGVIERPSELVKDESPNTVKDSSVAAITCSGLLTLYEFSEKEGFKEVADKILNPLCNNYLSGDDKEGILKHGCFHRPAGMGVDGSLIWSDYYYFMEALIKLKGER